MSMRTKLRMFLEARERIGPAVTVHRLQLGKLTVVVTSGHYPEAGSVFVITAYELIGRPLAAYRRRRKSKRGR